MRIGIAILLLVIGGGCSSKFLELKKPENIAILIGKIEAHNQRITQIKASLDVKAHGVMAGFLHEQADVVVQAPHYLYWSIRSFFGPPSVIVASNGEYLTVYDFSGQSASPYRKMALYDDTFFEVMEFRLHPASIINLFMQKIPLEKARNLQLSTREHQLEIRADLDGGWQLRSIFDLNAERVLMSEFKNDALMIEYQAKYLNFRTGQGMEFPASIVLLAKGKSRSAKLQIEFTHTELNGPLVLPDVFYLKPH